MTIFELLSILLLVAGTLIANAAPPTLLYSGNHEGPERGAPGDLLLLPGANLRADDQVFYERVEHMPDVRAPLAFKSLPVASNATRGSAPVVATHLVPNGLVVRLPRVMQPDTPYLLRVRSARGEYSPGVVVNGARPQWFSPAVIASSRQTAALPRQLKIVGRNLNVASGGEALLRLLPVQPRGAATAAEPALLRISSRRPGSEIARYVALFDLPAVIKPGRYRLAFASGEGQSWMPLRGQELNVEPDPIVRVVPWPKSCAADDGRDDTRCLTAAIATAARLGPAVVQLPRGTIDLVGAGAEGLGVDAVQGVLVPRGVSLQGAGAAVSRVRRAGTWRAPVLFTLLGENSISGIRFEDQRRYVTSDSRFVTLALGRSPAESVVLRDIHIFNNVFAWVHHAIVASGAPLQRLVVSGNEFGAYHDALLLDGDRFRPGAQFALRDSVIVNNVFKPGGYVECSIGQGAIASQIGASERLDFSNNSADGRSVEYVPSGTRSGWRAAFFWHLVGAQSDVLVASNRGSCTSDKAGDGEFLAFDNNGNATPFAGLARDVLSATADSVDVSASERGFGWMDQWFGAKVGDEYYVGQSLFVADGQGLGQVRTLKSVQRLPAGRVRFRLASTFDVVPTQTSRIVVTRAFSRLVVVGNESDQRNCANSNANRQRNGGLIGLWATASNSVIAGNRLYASGGILLQSQYDSGNNSALLQYNTQVRDNRIDGEAFAPSACSTGGIQLHMSARTWAGDAVPVLPRAVPIVQAYGVRVAQNRVHAADGLRGGAVVFADSWHQVPGARMYYGTLIDSNLVANVPTMRVQPAAPDPCRAGTCGSDAPVRGVGIHITQPGAVGTVLDRNTFTNTPTPLIDRGTDTRRVSQ